MPYKSIAQERFFNANRDEMESQGVNVDEWNESSKGMHLPKRVKKTRTDPHAHRKLMAQMLRNPPMSS